MMKMPAITHIIQHCCGDFGQCTNTNNNNEKVEEQEKSKFEKKQKQKKTTHKIVICRRCDCTENKPGNL